MKKINVVAGVIKKDDLILITQRDKGKTKIVDYKWEFPGGKIEENESKQDALMREIKEELNLEISINYGVGIFNDIYPDFEIEMTVYMCEILSGELKLNVHKNYKWISKQDLNSVDFAPIDILVKEKLLSIL